MSILSWNCANGLGNKLDSVKIVIQKHVPDLAFIQESEITDAQIGPCSIPGYELFCANTLETFGKARIVCYCKKNSFFRKIKTPDGIDLIGFECPDVIIFGLYRGFRIYDNTLPADYLIRYLDAIKHFNSGAKEIVIIGDFNIDPIRDENKWHGKILNEWALENGLVQHVRGVTRKRTILKANGQYQLQTYCC